MARLPTPTGGYKSIEIKSTWPGTQVITDTGASQRVNFDSHFYQFQITYPPMKRREYQQVIGFLQAQKGALGAFEVSLDYYKDSAGYAGEATSRPADEALYATTNYVRGDDAINYSSDWTSVFYNSGTNGDFLAVGDYITFANHTKLYQVTGFANPNSLGEGLIYFSPPLMEDVPIATAVEFMDVEARVFMNDKALVYSGGEYGWSEVAINVMEEI